MTKLLLSALYRSNPPAFAERAMTELEPGTKLQTNWHHKAIARKLYDTVSGVIRRLIVNQPPKTLKTHLISVCFVAWLLGSRPGQSLRSSATTRRWRPVSGV
jgi:hypothetical protein